MRRAPDRRVTVLLSVACLAASACVGGNEPPPPTPGLDGRLPPNVILVVTDDQSIGSMTGEPAAMPWLTERLGEPGWTTFTNAVVSTPMCCPSRATILTGRTARTTGVRTNEEGARLDESDTLAVWLHEAGYRTAMIGKYLNGYPWDRGPYVPEGWDRWFAKRNVSQATTYFGYEVVDDGRAVTVGHDPEDYATDRLAAEAVTFVRQAPVDRPFFLYLAPSAPHFPWEPAPRHEALLEQAPVGPPSFGELAAMNDVRGKPAWAQALAPVGETRATDLAGDRARERVALRAVDDAIRAVWGAVDARGELDRTVVVVVSDNGYAYGEHRWVGKACPWAPCLDVPLSIFVPATDGGATDTLMANLDLAPTIAELAGVTVPPTEGVSMAALLRGGAPPAREAVPISWIGGSGVPGWEGVRTEEAVYVVHDDGTRELYDLVRDPAELHNLAGLRRAVELEAHLADLLLDSLAGAPTGG